MLKKRFMLESSGLVFPTYHYMFDIFDRKLQQYIEADLISYNTRADKEFNNPKTYERSKESFAVLTLEELEAGFVVSLLPLLLSTVVFAIEWMPTLKNLVVFLFVFKSYFDVKTSEQFEHSERIKRKLADWRARKRVRTGNKNCKKFCDNENGREADAL